MNLYQLKFVVEVARTGSITKAAQNLFVAQSNLSNAIKSLEEEIGVTIFNRTQHGTETTPEGVRFLDLARPIIYQMNSLEAEYTRQNTLPAQINISSVRTAMFTTYALCDVINNMPPDKKAHIRFHENNAMEVIGDVFSGRFSFGVIKYFLPFAQYYNEVMDVKGLTYDVLFESKVHLLMSKHHALAEKGVISPEDLIPFVEAGIGENESQLIPYSIQRERAGVYEGSKVLYTYDRASLLHMLSECEGSFMWISRVPKDLLNKYNLVMKETSARLSEAELIIYPSNKPLGALEKEIIDRLKALITQDVREANP